jgi:tetratricopeptide (TPR) repeat protein/O-antigen ligase
MTDRWQRLGLGCVEVGWLTCVVAVPLALSAALALTFTADKVLLFRVLVELIALAALLLWMSRARLRPAPLALALGAYGFILCLATVGGRNPSQSFWGSYPRLFGLFTLAHGGALYLVVAAHLRTEQQWRRLLGAVALVSGVVCCHALLQWWGQDSRVMGFLLGRPGFHWSGPGSESGRPFATLGNSSYLGTFLLFAIAFTLGALLTQPRSRRWPAFALLALQLFVLVINQTRGAWLGAGVLGLTFALLTLPARRRRPILLAATLLPLAAGLVGVAGARSPNAPWVVSNPVCARLAYFFQHNRNSSGWYRLDMWQRVVADVAASPAALLLGYGPESYQLVASRSFVPAYADGPEGAQFMDSSHNIFADTLVDAGLLGLAALLAVLFLACRTGLRSLRSATTPARRAVLVTALSALAGYVVQGMFLFHHVVGLVYLCVVLGLLVAASRDDWGVGAVSVESGSEVSSPALTPGPSPKAGRGGTTKGSSSGTPLPVVGRGAGGEGRPGDPFGLPRARRLAPRAVGLAGITVICLVLLPANRRIYRALALKQEAELLAASGQNAAATAALREACWLTPYERTCHVDLASSIAAEAPPFASGDPDAIRTSFRAAERELKQAVALDPGDVRTYWPLGLLYQFWGRLDAGKYAASEQVYRQAAALSPRRQRTYWAWGDLLLAQGRRLEAVAQYRYALSLDPSVKASQRALARLYIRLGQPEQAEPLYERAWRGLVPALVPPPERPQQAAEQEALGLAFLARGRAEKARAYLSAALELDPGLPRARAALGQLLREQAAVVGTGASRAGRGSG